MQANELYDQTVSPLIGKGKLPMDIMVIGYGSLMSDAGLSSSGQFHIRSACIVALPRCARGFAKLARRGNYLAADLEIDTPPMEGRVMGPEVEVDAPVETMALTVSPEEMERLSKREGYPPTAFQKVVHDAQAEGLGPAEFLWNVDAAGGHDLVTYRRRLLALTGHTSPHYIPHPVRVDASSFALAFLAPGFEGTGSDELISIRQQTGMQILLPTTQAWQHRPHDRQLVYFLSCLLGGVHGIGIHDLLASIADDASLAAALRQRLRQMLPTEHRRFLATTGLSQTQYQQAFGAPDAALRRSGLQAFLDQGRSRQPQMG